MVRSTWTAQIDSIVQEIKSTLSETIDPTRALASLQIWIGSSTNRPEIAEAATILREIFQQHGATVLAQTAAPWNIDDGLIQDQLRRVDLIAMLAVTPGVSAEALELCATNKDATAKMIVYMPEEYQRGYIYDSLVRKYRAKVWTFPLDELVDDGSSQLCGRMFCDALEIVSDKVRREKLRPQFAPRIGIITALEVEFRAAKRILTGIHLDNSRPKDGIYKEYVHGKIASDCGGEHDVVLALAGKGNNKAAVRATQLLGDFNTVGEIFMIGIAAGVPHPRDAADHVRLGDVVVSDETGVIQYDMIKRRSFGTEYASYPRPTDADWVKRARHYFADPPSNPRYWSYIDIIMKDLSIRRPTIAPLRDCPWVDGSVAVRHPSDRDRVKGRPRLFMGAIGSANTVLKSANVREKLRKKFKVKAIEMEGSGISEAAWEFGRGYMIVRGIADYANDGKNDRWHDYASVVAAAFTRELIESMPVRSASGDD